MDARSSLGQHAEPVATAQSTHQHSGAHHAITSGGHTSVSAGKSWLVSAKDAIRLFAYKAGIRLIAAGADVEVKSLSQNINMLAKLDITQTANRIEINAKEEAFAPGGARQLNWSLDKHLGPDKAKAFRHAYLHLSLSERTGMAPRYKNDTELERLHVPG